MKEVKPNEVKLHAEARRKNSSLIRKCLEKKKNLRKIEINIPVLSKLLSN